MEEQIKELLENLKDLKENINNSKEKLKNAFEGKATIKFEYENGICNANIEGGKTTMLIALAILEKTILENTKASTKFYEAIKKAINEAEINE